MYRALVLTLTLTILPVVAAAQQPCTNDARHVVNELYRHMLERSTDPSSAHWVQQLESGRMTVRDVVRAIATSPEYTRRFVYTETGESTPHERSVARLYRHLLARQADSEGQRAYAQMLQQQGTGAVINSITSSREYNEQFGDWGVPGSGGVRFCATGTVSSQTEDTEPQARVARRFRGMDRNNDGIITRGEWRGSDRSFEVHDWNNDGVLSGREVEPGAARVGRTLEDEDFERAEEFEFLDTNNNGRIELREWHGTAAAFDRLDVNNDNRLSQAEFARSAGVGAAATSGQSILVDPRQRWTDTGIYVSAGDLITFDVSGTVQLSNDPNDDAGPGGAFSGRRAAQAPLARHAAGALIGRIGNGDPFFIGNQRSARVRQSGRLYLGVNDDYLADNAGRYDVLVTVQ